MYVSGDLGEAVFNFTEKAYPERIARYDLGYFEEKLVAFSDARRDFDRDKAEQHLAEWKKDQLESNKKFDKDVYIELIDMIRDSSTIREWEFQLQSFDMSKVYDGWEWLSGIGSVTPMRVQSYLIGLKMANEQLNPKEAEIKKC